MPKTTDEGKERVDGQASRTRPFGHTPNRPEARCRRRFLDFPNHGFGHT